jgi:hypothetical protein
MPSRERRQKYPSHELTAEAEMSHAASQDRVSVPVFFRTCRLPLAMASGGLWAWITRRGGYEEIRQNAEQDLPAPLRDNGGPKMDG